MKKIIAICSLIFVFFSTGLHAKEFLDTIVHLNLGFFYTMVEANELFDAESGAFSLVDSESGKTVRPKHTHMGLSGTLDVTPFDPLVLGRASHALKFGIRGVFRFHDMSQSLEAAVGGDSKKDHGGGLATYMTWLVGPVIYYSPWMHIGDLTGSFRSRGGFTLFVLMGRVFEGSLTAYPAMRNRGGSPTGYVAAFDGYSVNAGLGGEVGVCSVNLGVNFFYSYTKLDLSEIVYAQVGKDGISREFCMEIYVGLAVDNFVKMPSTTRW